MNELNEINLRRSQKTWQSKQDSSGLLAMITCAATVGAFLYFVSSPSGMSVGILGVAMVAMMGVCARMVSCAAKVVEAKHTLQPVRVSTEVIDVEVVESERRPAQYQIPHYV